MADLNALRQIYGDKSDEELISAVSKESGIPMADIASEVGYKIGGKWGNRMSGAVDAAQAQLADTTHAAASGLGWGKVADWADQSRQSNEAAAKVHRQFAADQGAVMDWRDVKGVGSAAEFVGGLAVDTLPQMGATVVGSALGGLAGTAVAGPAGTIPGAMAGGVLAGAPFDYGDIRGTQRELTGNTNDAAALGLLPFYSALNVIGPEGKMLVGAGKGIAKTLGKEVIEESVEQGAKVAAKEGILPMVGRGAKAFAGGALKEGGSEMGQEVVNQAGVIAADPNLRADQASSWMAHDAGERYLSSFIGGAALGGVIDTAGHALGGSRPATQQPVVDKNLLTGEANTTVTTPQTSPAQAPAQPTAGAAPTVGGVPLAEAQGAPTPPAPPAPAAPETPEQAEARVQAESDQQAMDRIKSVRTELGVKEDGTGVHGKKMSDTTIGNLSGMLDELKAARDEGIVTPEEYRANLSALRINQPGQVRKFIGAKLEAAQKAKGEDAKPAVSKGTTASAAVPATSGTTVSGADQTAAVPGAEVATASATTPQAATAAPAAATADEAIARARAEGVSVAGKPAGQQVEQMLQVATGKAPRDDVQRQRIYLKLGLDKDGNFTGGTERTWDQVAQIEAEATGKKVTPQAISKDVNKLMSDKQAKDIVSALHLSEKGSGDVRVMDTGEVEGSERGSTMASDETAEATETGAGLAERATDEEGNVAEGELGNLTWAEGGTTRGEAGVTEKTSATSNIGEGRDLFDEARGMLQKAQRMRSLTNDQRANVKALLDRANAIRADKALKPAQKAVALREAVQAAREGQVGDVEKFFNALDTHLTPQRTTAAQERAAAAVAQTKEEVDPGLEAANQAQIEKNRVASAVDKESEQWREQKMMSEEGRAELLLHELRRVPEAIPYIEDARGEWADLMEPNDDTEIPFAEMDPDLQAAWVKYTHSLNTEKDETKYNNLAERQSPLMGELMQQQQSPERNRRGADQTTAANDAQEANDQPGAAQEAQGQNGLGDEAAHDRGAGDQGQADSGAVQAAAASPAEGSQRPQDAANSPEQRGTGTLENLERITMTGAAPAGSQTVTGRQRAPSLKRIVRKARGLLDEGTITADQFAAQTSAALDAADNAELYSDIPARQRGALILREKLLAAQRRGEINADMVEFADWMLRQNPQWATDLGISLKQRTDQNRGTAGYYTPMNRILTLIKGTDSSQTAVHEILHHLERMMPVPMQNAIRREWTKRLAREHKRAMKGSNTDLQTYYQALMDYHFGDGSDAHLREAKKLLKDGKVGYENYQHFNPSEFWAINGTDIMQRRYDVSESMIGRIASWLNEVVARIKGAVGLRSNQSIINALNSLAHSDGTYQTGVMISGEPGVHFMYAGQKAIDQERAAQFSVFEQMNEFGFDAKATRAATGWWMGDDDKPRYEFSDHNAKLKIDPMMATRYDQNATNDERAAATYRLADVIDHPELFKRYPEAAEIKVRFNGDPNSSYNGEYADNIMGLNVGRPGRTAADVLSTALHETQHWVQEKEGFAPGTNTRFMAYKLPDEIFEQERQNALTWLGEKAMQDSIRADNFDHAMAHPRIQELFDAEDRLKGLQSIRTPEAFQERTALREQARAIADEIAAGMEPDEGLGNVATHLRAMLSGPEGFKDRFKFQRKAAEKAVEVAKAVKNGTRKEASPGVDRYLAASGKDYDYYRATHGESEARDVQRRQALTPEQRAALTPMEDTVYSDLFGTGRETPFVQLPFSFNSLAASEDRDPGFQNIERITQGFPPAAKTTAKGAFDMAKSLAAGKGNKASWLQAARFTRDILASAKKAMGQSAVDYENAMNAVAARRLGMQREVARIVDDFKTKLTEAERKTANKFMHDSTLHGKWGFAPNKVDANWIPNFKDTDLDPAMVARFDALPEHAQAVIKEMFRHEQKMLEAMRAAVQAKAANVFGPDEQAKRDAFMQRFDKLTRIAENKPYLPLKRFGDWVVAYKSQAMQDAEAIGNRSEIEKLQIDPAHYSVSFRETRAEALKLRDEMAGVHGAEFVDMRNRDDGYSDAFGSGVQTLGLITRLKNTVNDSETEANAKAALSKLLTDFELSMMQENSVRQSERRRVGVTGAEQDMARSFGTKGMSEANFIAAMEAGGQAETALAQMKTEARKWGVRGGMDGEERQSLFNELSKRHYMGMDYKPSPVVEGMMRISSMFQLLFNPAYHLQNALQPLTMSAPYIAGKRGLGRTYASFTRAYREVMPNIKSISKAIEAGDYSGLPTDVQDVVKALVDRGMISADQIFEHGRIKWKTDTEGGLVPKPIVKVNQVMEEIGANVELNNRIVTAMAAYRLARQDGQTHEQAVEDAHRSIYETHGDYSGFNSPRAMRAPVARLLTQYRKFQLIQLGLWGRMFRDSFGKGTNLTPVERGVARRQLAYSLGTMFSVGGFLGLPGAQLISKMIAAIFGDEDDPDDFEMKARALIGDDTLADLLLKGIPAALGVDVSGKLGASTILTPLPYAEIPHDRDTYMKTVTAALGPFIGGLMPKAIDGIGQYSQGNYWKGTENMLPNGFGNALKGVRLATAGMTQKNGDLVMTPDEISTFDGAMQAIGLPTTKVSNRALVQGAKYNADQFFKGRTTELKRDYVQAYRDGDTEAMMEVRARWNEVNAQRAAHGFKPQPLSDLVKAPRESQRRERSAIAGVIPGGRRDAGAVRYYQELTE